MKDRNGIYMASVGGDGEKKNGKQIKVVRLKMVPGKKDGVGE